MEIYLCMCCVFNWLLPNANIFICNFIIVLLKKYFPKNKKNTPIVGDMVAPAGIEPATHGASIRCSTDWATEPWRSRRGSNPRSPPWQGGVLNHFTTGPLVAGTGLEPMTFGLWARRATNCSTPRCNCFIKLLINYTKN